jgi:hypothetical protein
LLVKKAGFCTEICLKGTGPAQRAAVKWRHG